MKEMQNKVISLEKTLSHVVREFEREREVIGTLAKEELDTVRGMVNRLRERLLQKTTEIRHIKVSQIHIFVFHNIIEIGTAYFGSTYRSGTFLY